MEKKQYITPTMKVVTVKSTGILCSSMIVNCNEYVTLPTDEETGVGIGW